MAIQRKAIVAPFQVRTPFQREKSEGSSAGNSGIARAQIVWLQSLQKGINSSAQLVTVIPSTSTDVGEAGSLAFDANWLYICIAKNNWRRVALGAF